MNYFDESKIKIDEFAEHMSSRMYFNMCTKEYAKMAIIKALKEG